MIVTINSLDVGKHWFVWIKREDSDAAFFFRKIQHFTEAIRFAITMAEHEKAKLFYREGINSPKLVKDYEGDT